MPISLSGDYTNGKIEKKLHKLVGRPGILSADQTYTYYHARFIRERMRVCVCVCVCIEIQNMRGCYYFTAL